MHGIRTVLPLLFSLTACVSVKDSFSLAGMSAEQQADFAKADIILIGEQHDNPQHHRIQRDLLEKLGSEGRLKAVVFEQVDWTAQGVLSQLNRDNLIKLPARLHWETSGWPDYAYYRPLFETAVKYRARLIAGGLPKDRIQILYKQGYEGAFSASEIERLRLRDSLSPVGLAQLKKEIFDDHCQLVPEDHVAKMVPIQRARDAAMIRGWQNEAPGSGTTVFILGAGHARKDYGIPTLLKTAAPASRVFAIGLEEEGAPKPPDGAFDDVITTERFDRPDPCVAMKEHMDRKSKADGPDKTSVESEPKSDEIKPEAKADGT